MGKDRYRDLATMPKKAKKPNQICAEGKKKQSTKKVVANTKKARVRNG